MTSSTQQRILRYLPWLIGPLYCGVLTLCMGQDANWDLRNYHFYNPYAFLHQRLDYDVAPAQVATFYNPLFYIPFYEAVLRLPPMLVGFLLGALQGLNFPLLLAIARNFMAGDSSVPWWRGFLIALLGVLGAGNISELGTMFGDNLTSLLILGGLWLLLTNFSRLTDQRRIIGALLPVIVAGVMFGLAVGLKQPAAIFAVGWCVALLFLPLPVGQRIGLAFFFGVGVLAGVAAGGGYWLHEMWSRYGNPLFPYYNRIFHSPMASMADYRDARFLPRSLLDALLFPFIIVQYPFRTAETTFRDLRLPLFMVLLVVSGLPALLTKFKKSSPTSDPASPGLWLARHKKRFLLIGCLVAYAMWLKMFAIYRYLLPLEMLTPLGIWLLIDTLPWRRLVKNLAALGCIVLLLVTLRPGNWGRVSWGNDYFGVTPPPLTDPAHTIVLMTGVDPMSYVIPFFPEPVRFLRIQSYFTKPSDSPNGFDRLMQRLIADHRGPLYVLYGSYQEEEQSRDALQAYGLAIDPGSCRPLITHIDECLNYPLIFCAAAPNNTVNNRGKNK
ncbi:MAG: hypothetical protein KKC76_17920 [Proteobacteria bacterium]|nr:hypothetical protein [Pseudomonadota bacterium]MBU4297319.1 hypothetical protein [Pseudomonadota bacterium]MCG2747753.1 hypothetical protein [Desulfobulbaceae bacterium]